MCDAILRLAVHSRRFWAVVSCFCRFYVTICYTRVVRSGRGLVEDGDGMQLKLLINLPKSIGETKMTRFIKYGRRRSPVNLTGGFAALVLILGLATSAQAQQSGGSIKGTVVGADSSTVVEVVDQRRGTTKSEATSSDGSFRFDGLTIRSVRSVRPAGRSHGR